MTGAELRALRLRLDLTQQEMADRLGISASAVAKLESGRNKLRGSTAKLIELLNVEQ